MQLKVLHGRLNQTPEILITCLYTSDYFLLFLSMSGKSITMLHSRHYFWPLECNIVPEGFLTFTFLYFILLLSHNVPSARCHIMGCLEVGSYLPAYPSNHPPRTEDAFGRGLVADACCDRQWKGCAPRKDWGPHLQRKKNRTCDVNVLHVNSGSKQTKDPVHTHPGYQVYHQWEYLRSLWSYLWSGWSAPGTQAPGVSLSMHTGDKHT